ncbi:MAG: Poly-beta-hydroxybutyrate polymerase domain protein [Acidimicrobiaceae bacterium]|nr:Poly-beta-hydroxybutyrate polymerase domain protein [Acidimicrobiaceae bacterium]
MALHSRDRTLVESQNETWSATDQSSRLAGQLLSALQLSQDVTMHFVSAWFSGATEVVTKLVEMTAPPTAGGIPTANELLTFVQRLHAEQQSFIQDLMVKSDPVSFLGSLKAVQMSLLTKPGDVAAASARLAIGLDAAVRATIECASGATPAAPLSPSKGDVRFTDSAYAENPLYFLLEQEYLLSCQYVNELLDAAQLAGDEDQKARFAAKFILDALAPTNTLLGNPAALREAFSTGGESLVRGAKNMLQDLRQKGGWPSQVDTSGFELGVNLAATPGAVVYRNQLIELIEYAPQTNQVYSVPMLFCPPWINKYYVMDLAPGRSLVEWAVQHGHTSFAISYRNPDSSMRELGFEDYLRLGLFDALRVIREITHALDVNTVSLCLGGTMTAIGLAYNSAVGDTSMRTATFLNTFTDFSEPGVLGLFTDEATIAGLELQMAKDGILEADAMSHVFDTLRANDLIFQYVGNNWLEGKQPPAFDLLAWNSDGTRMPAKMHSEYLRSCFLNNEFVKNEFTIDGRKVYPKDVKIDTYVVAAINDHIVPWRSGYKTATIFSGPNRFVLTTAGHIAGIVNPPGPKPKYWSNDARPDDANVWKDEAKFVDDTWWQDWSEWVGERAGEHVAAPEHLGSAAHPPLESAPGTYVRVRA